MTNKKRRRRPAARAGGRSTAGTRGGTISDGPAASRTAPSRAGAKPARREHKEEARRAREAARKRAARTAALRRVLTISVVGVLAIGLFTFLNRAASARPIPKYAVDAAKAAGCSGVDSPASDAPGGLHLASGASYSYSQHPPTSGYHDPVPLPIPSDHVFTAPVQETHAVHNIEHGEIFIYYRDQGDGALPPAVVAALKKVVGLPSNKNTLLAPYRDFSDPKTALAFTAWNKLQTCPGTITAAQATSVAYGFEYAFACTGNAPEPKASGNDC